MRLLTTNTKLEKGNGLPCYGLQLAPHALSGYNVCPMASDTETPTNTDDCLDVLECGGCVAVPFSCKKNEKFPDTWNGFKVVDGDADDRIWTRSRGGMVLGLHFKGDRKNIHAGCKQYCIYTSGHGRFDGVKGARLLRTRLLMESRKLFFDMLTQEIDKLVKKHPGGLAIRLNVFSDLAWETSGWACPDGRGALMSAYPQITWYDYTKVKRRVDAYLAGTLPGNYHLVFSYNKVCFEKGDDSGKTTESETNGDADAAKRA